MDHSRMRIWATIFVVFVLLVMTGCLGLAQPAATKLPRLPSTLQPSLTLPALPTLRASATVTLTSAPTLTATGTQTPALAYNAQGYYHPKVCTDLTSFPGRTLPEGDYIRACVDEVEIFPNGMMTWLVDWYPHLPGLYALLRAHLDQSNLYGWVPIDISKEALYLTDDLGNHYECSGGDTVWGNPLYIEAKQDETYYNTYFSFPPIVEGAVWFTLHHVSLFDLTMKFDPNDPGYSIYPSG